MQLNENGEVIWSDPPKEVTDLYRAGIYWHLFQQFDKQFKQPETAGKED